MFVRVSTLILAIATSAIAGHMGMGGGHGGPTASTVNQCNNGELQCCNNVVKASQAPSDITNILKLDSNTPIGLDCSPLSILQLGGDSQCNQQAVCCSNTRTVTGNQLVGINCSPVNVNA